MNQGTWINCNYNGSWLILVGSTKAAYPLIALDIENGSRIIDILTLV